MVGAGGKCLRCGIAQILVCPNGTIIFASILVDVLGNGPLVFKVGHVVVTCAVVVVALNLWLDIFSYKGSAKWYRRRSRIDAANLPARRRSKQGDPSQNRQKR